MSDPQHAHLLDATMFWSPSGGVKRYICAKRRWLRKNTHCPHTVATPMPDDVGALRLPSLPLPGSGGAYRVPWRRGASARALCAAQPDLIEAADPYRLAWSALDAAHLLNVPCVAFCHSNLSQLAGLAAGPRLRRVSEQVARQYAAHLYGNFDLVLAPSRAMVAHLHDWGIRAAAHQSLGVDTEIFSPDRCDPTWRATLGLPPTARVLVYAGRFAPEKNLPTLTKAVSLLGSRFWLLAIGAGPTPPRGERVIVMSTIGESKALARVLASCDVFVHAGQQETFGLAALEAMACGIPVVAGSAEGMGELVDHSVGSAVEGTNAASFADAISDVFERDRTLLGTLGRKRAEERDWDRVMPSLWERYRALLARSTTTG